MKHLLACTLISCLSSTLYAGSLYIEAESFQNKGGWVLDQQFMDQMGSPYLMAHGLGTAVQDAHTTIDIAEEASYHIYARCYNWTAPWSNKEGPGQFQIKLNGTLLPTLLGATGTKWGWQYAGELHLSKGQHSIELHDLQGFNARCDAIYLTTEKGATPPEEGAELETFRRELMGLSEKATMKKPYDFVVLGAGVAGMSAAVSAARLGLKVALVNDRPILGGNNSSEIRVHLGGRIEVGPYEKLGDLQKEFGHSQAGNAKPASYYEDDKKAAIIAAEHNITLYPNYRAYKLSKEGNKISSVIARHIESNEDIELVAPLFADCTGDGTIGYLAGADYRMGREARAEFGESLAPLQADKMTMGASVQWNSQKMKQATPFPDFAYGIEFNEENAQQVTMGEWTWETGMHLHQIDQAERIRDYGLLVIFSNWSFLKNKSSRRETYAQRALDWVAYVAGKRESRRLLGDYILKEDDITKAVFHEDGTAATTWSIDLHYPEPKNSQFFPGQEFKSIAKHQLIHPYPVPFRCLYSRNIDNLMMAGRNISVTHVALGTTRVMRTTGMLGEVIGMAAKVSKEKGGALPREIYQRYLPELKDLMMQGVGKGDKPNNQQFNMGGSLGE